MVQAGCDQQRQRMDALGASGRAGSSGVGIGWEGWIAGARDGGIFTHPPDEVSKGFLQQFAVCGGSSERGIGWLRNWEIAVARNRPPHSPAPIPVLAVPGATGAKANS